MMKKLVQLDHITDQIIWVSASHFLRMLVQTFQALASMFYDAHFQECLLDRFGFDFKQ